MTELMPTRGNFPAASSSALLSLAPWRSGRRSCCSTRSHLPSDPELRGEVLNVIRRLAVETGMTVLIVTHEMGFARQISDRVIFMSEGRIVEDATPDQIFNRPSSARTAAFLQAVLDPTSGDELPPVSGSSSGERANRANGEVGR